MSEIGKISGVRVGLEQCMENLREIITKQMERYPKMQPQDGVKLLYQNEFGSGHFVRDQEENGARLLAEWQTVSAPTRRQEPLGNGVCRLHLGGAPDRGVVQAVGRLFMKSAKMMQGNTPSFERKLFLLLQMAGEGLLPFSQMELEEYLDAYRKAAYPPVSHSESYRTAYRPAYRVMLARYAALLDAVARIDELLQMKGRAVVAIDGPCGSGKSTAGKVLAELYDDCALIQMDDFFLPPALRTPERLGEDGGNIHYERFLTQVLPGLARRESFTYPVFDCSVMDYGERRVVPSRALTIVEGSYSLHPRLREAYDYAIFTTCSPEEQKRRILERNGPELYSRFVDEWIPMENRYFERFAVEQACQLTLNTQLFSLE